ncbi:unnamed protein product [Ectocarpus fasciculatus]
MPSTSFTPHTKERGCEQRTPISYQQPAPIRKDLPCQTPLAHCTRKKEDANKYANIVIYNSLLPFDTHTLICHDSRAQPSADLSIDGVFSPGVFMETNAGAHEILHTKTKP